MAMVLAQRFFRFRKMESLVGLSCLAMLSYFTWYSFYGARGLPYRDRLSGELVILEKQATDLTATRIAFDDRVKLLRPESIDPDLLDELARKELNMGKSNDIVVYAGQ
jgi:cell division protein FtsB